MAPRPYTTLASSPPAPTSTTGSQPCVTPPLSLHCYNSTSKLEKDLLSTRTQNLDYYHSSCTTNLVQLKLKETSSQQCNAAVNNKSNQFFHIRISSSISASLKKPFSCLRLIYFVCLTERFKVHSEDVSCGHLCTKCYLPLLLLS